MRRNAEGNVIHAPPGYPTLDGTWGKNAYQATTATHNLAFSKATLDKFCKAYGTLVFMVPRSRDLFLRLKLPHNVTVWPSGLRLFVLFIGPTTTSSSSSSQL